MPEPIQTFVDDELALIQYLRLRPSVTALCPAGNIRTELPAGPVYPYVLVHSLGGYTDGRPHRVDTPSVQVDVLGDPLADRADCKRLALAVRAAIVAIANDSVPAGVLSSAREDSTPQWLPDAQVNPPAPRFVARYRLVIHP